MKGGISGSCPAMSASSRADPARDHDDPHGQQRSAPAAVTKAAKRRLRKLQVEERIAEQGREYSNWVSDPHRPSREDRQDWQTMRSQARAEGYEVAPKLAGKQPSHFEKVHHLRPKKRAFGSVAVEGGLTPHLHGGVAPGAHGGLTPVAIPPPPPSASPTRMAVPPWRARPCAAPGALLLPPPAASPTGKAVPPWRRSACAPAVALAVSSIGSAHGSTLPDIDSDMEWTE